MGRAPALRTALPSGHLTRPFSVRVSLQLVLLAMLMSKPRLVARRESYVFLLSTPRVGGPEVWVGSCRPVLLSSPARCHTGEPASVRSVCSRAAPVRDAAS